MIVTFKPDEGEARVYEFKPDRLMFVEAEELERLTKLPYEGGFQQAIFEGSALARRALTFVFEKRTHPTLAWKTFGDFPVSAIKVEYDKSELADMRAALATAPLTDEERAQASAAIDQLEVDAPEAPKAPPSAPVDTDI